MELKEINKEQIVEKARGLIKWHFHFLTPNCIFNEKDKFALILEDEISKESFVCYFDERPTELEVLENLFYKRGDNANN